MPLIPLTPPAEEPVSLAAAKRFLRLDHPDDDALIATLIAAARATVEAFTGCAIVTRTVRETLDVWPQRLSVRPVQSIEAIRVRTITGDALTLDPSLYALIDGDTAPRVRFLAPPPAPAGGPGGIEIDYVAGFGDAADAPPALQQACLGLVAHLYANREADAPTPSAIFALMTPFARARL
jgi:uncharacterized phiE125 gp8 family phage protein